MSKGPVRVEQEVDAEKEGDLDVVSSRNSPSRKRKQRSTELARLGGIHYDIRG